MFRRTAAKAALKSIVMFVIPRNQLFICFALNTFLIHTPRAQINEIVNFPRKNRQTGCRCSGVKSAALCLYAR